MFRLKGAAMLAGPWEEVSADGEGAVAT